MLEHNERLTTKWIDLYLECLGRLSITIYCYVQMNPKIYKIIRELFV